MNLSFLFPSCLSIMQFGINTIILIISKLVMFFFGMSHRNPSDLEWSLDERMNETCDSRPKETPILSVNPEINNLLKEIQQHILNIQLVALEIHSGWDHGAGLNTVFHENHHAKEKIQIAEEIAKSCTNKEVLEHIWNIDSLRASSSISAWDRIRRGKKKIMIDVMRTDDDSIAKPGLVAFSRVEMIGGRFLYKIMIKNISEYVVTDVTTTLVSYPNECMDLTGDAIHICRRLEGGGFINTAFVLTPKKDCVEGSILSNIAYVDYKDKLSILPVEPAIIRSICDLLKPLESSTDSLNKTLTKLLAKTQTKKLEWNPRILFKKTIALLPKLNFYIVDDSEYESENKFKGKIRGLAIGKYTEKKIAVVLHFEGEVNGKSTDVCVEMFGDDEAMLPNTIEELSGMMNAWLCLSCGGELNVDHIMQLATGSVIQCPYCGHSLSADLYEREKKTIKPQLMKSNLSSALIAESEIMEGQDLIFESQQQTVEAIELSSKPRDYSILRGHEIIGGKFHYKVKIINNTNYVITNVVTTIVSYPRDCLILESDVSRFILRIEGGGFRSFEFVFHPTKDCVEGKIISTVSIVDMKDNLHSFPVREVTLKSVCDLLKPLETSVKSMELLLPDFTSASEEVVLDWNSRVLYIKVKHLLPSSNFFIVDESTESKNGQFEAVIRGFAEGKYTKKRIASVIHISGHQDEVKSTVKIDVIGEDITMLPTAVIELKESLNSWICLCCGGKISGSQVLKIKGSYVVSCEFCGESLSKELYSI